MVKRTRCLELTASSHRRNGGSYFLPVNLLSPVSMVHEPAASGCLGLPANKVRAARLN